MPKTFQFATYSERSFYDVEAETEEEARAKLEANPDAFYTGRHHDCIEYELIDVVEPGVPCCNGVGCSQCEGDGINA